MSARSDIIKYRTYSRELSDGYHETWEQIVHRVISHQKWLWERELKRCLNVSEMNELTELQNLIYLHKVSVSGRTLWLGGTETAKTRESSMFNCSFLEIYTISDVVDAYWLLLQGCGVGFKPRVGVLSGFSKKVDKLTCYSSRATKKDFVRGFEKNASNLSSDKKSFVLSIGDSAEAWAKSIGKLLALKSHVEEVIVDFCNIRPAGIRLKGYGWISSGYKPLEDAIRKIFKILNARAGNLLDFMDILDIMNILGTTLSSRRSAEIAVYSYGDTRWKEFALAKRDCWMNVDLQHRSQSNNSLIFWKKPSKTELTEVFDLMRQSGGSEPGIINGETALKRAQWFSGTNPCAETLLSNKSFCNLSEVNLNAFNGCSMSDITRAIRLLARANYRQTCVDLHDGVLQPAWHEVNSFLRLCGVGLTGIIQWERFYESNVWLDLQELRRNAHLGADQMADELNLPRSKLVTVVKPSGTLSKIMDCSEGCHAPIGKYVFNEVSINRYDTDLIQKLKESFYNIVDHPVDKNAVLVRLPVEFNGGQYKKVHGIELTVETAIDQLDRYKVLMDNYVDHNCSITVYYRDFEIHGIIEWLLENWDSYVAIAFLPWKDLSNVSVAYAYMPQRAVSKEEYDDYVQKLKPFRISGSSKYEINDDECLNGMCLNK